MASVPLEPFESIEPQVFIRSRKFSFTIDRLRLPNGAVGDWSCIRHPGGALAVPVTPDGELVLVKQYRFAMQGRILEFPAGTIEDREDPFSTIQREIEEETGYRAHRWTDLGQFPLAPGYSDELIYAYLAQDLERLDIPPAQDEDEDIETILMTPADFEAAVHRGDGIDAKSIASYFLARPYLELL
ncbi:NUDIX hydrolase [Altericista sp. CCNU0014]|uniref:NUDIX hydrolase n=1 Tax=Altericista sp. CCNU0014 TaxID=3082949 RepID=UPI003850178E